MFLFFVSGAAVVYLSVIDTSTCWLRSIVISTIEHPSQKTIPLQADQLFLLLQQQHKKTKENIDMNIDRKVR